MNLHQVSVLLTSSPKLAAIVLEKLMKLLVRLGAAGIIHGDFNEFNLMVRVEEGEGCAGSGAAEVTMIDFPQVVTMDHRDARLYFERDVECVRSFFRKRWER